MTRSRLAVPSRLRLSVAAAHDDGPETSTPAHRAGTLTSTSLAAPNPLPTPRQAHRVLSPIAEHASTVLGNASLAWPADLNDATQLFAAARPADMSLWGGASPAGALHDIPRAPSAAVNVDNTLLLEQRAFNHTSDTSHQLGLGAKLFELLTDSAAVTSPADASVSLDKSHCAQQVLDRIELGNSRIRRTSQEGLVADRAAHDDPFTIVANRTANDTIVAVRFNDDDESSEGPLKSVRQEPILTPITVNTLTKDRPAAAATTITIEPQPQPLQKPRLSAPLYAFTRERDAAMRQSSAVQSQAIRVTVDPTKKTQSVKSITSAATRPVTSACVRRARKTTLLPDSAGPPAVPMQDIQPASAAVLDSDASAVPNVTSSGNVSAASPKGMLAALHTELLAKTLRSPHHGAAAAVSANGSSELVVARSAPQSGPKRKVHFTPPDVRPVASRSVSAIGSTETSTDVAVAALEPVMRSVIQETRGVNPLVDIQAAAFTRQSKSKSGAPAGKCDDMFSRRQRDRSRDATPHVSADINAETTVPGPAAAAQSAAYEEATQSEHGILTRPSAFNFGQRRTVLGKRRQREVDEHETAGRIGSRRVHAAQFTPHEDLDSDTAALTVERLKAQEASLDASANRSGHDVRQETSLTRQSLLHRYIEEQTRGEVAPRCAGTLSSRVSKLTYMCSRVDGSSAFERNGQASTSSRRAVSRQRDQPSVHSSRPAAGPSKRSDAHPLKPNGQSMRSSVAHAARRTRPSVTAASQPSRSHASSQPLSNEAVASERAKFEARLAEWHTREAEAAEAGKGVLQPILSDRGSNARPISDAPSKDKRRLSSAPAKKTAPVAFNFASDRRLADRREWEARRRAKEKILVELAELERLEHQQAEEAERKRIRAAQVPEILPVPEFYKKRRLTVHRL